MTHPTPHVQDQRDLVRKARIALSRVITRDVLSRDALAEAVQLLESALASPAQAQVTEEMVERGAKALYAKARFPIAWDGAYEIDKGSYRDKARLALESALARPDGERG